VTWRIERFDRQRHRREGFHCGERSLDDYLMRQATQDLRRDLASLFCLVEDDHPEIVGYYTLCAASLPVDDLAAELARGLPRYAQVPAVLLGRLAVRRERQGARLGEALLFDAMTRSLDNPVAAWCVLVDALNQRAADWYASYGLRSLPDQPLRMMVTMKTIRSLTPGR
jgi:predicted N-acetyltransferase YhbS